MTDTPDYIGLHLAMMRASSLSDDDAAALLAGARSGAWRPEARDDLGLLLAIADDLAGDRTGVTWAGLTNEARRNYRLQADAIRESWA